MLLSMGLSAVFAAGQDCWNRPIASAPGAYLDVMERTPVAGQKCDLCLHLPLAPVSDVCSDCLPARLAVQARNVKVAEEYTLLS